MVIDRGSSIFSRKKWCFQSLPASVCLQYYYVNLPWSQFTQSLLQYNDHEEPGGPQRFKLEYRRLAKVISNEARVIWTGFL